MMLEIGCNFFLHERFICSICTPICITIALRGFGGKRVMIPCSIRLRESLKEKVEEISTERGYRSCSAFMVEAIEEKLRRDEALESVSETEARIAASFNQVHRQLQSLHTAIQSQFALTDALAKYLLTCVVEPPGELLTSARARAKDRYEKLLRMAAKTITREIENPLMET